MYANRELHAAKMLPAVTFHRNYIKKCEIYAKCFGILGVKETDDQNTVRRAYLNLVKQVHPDSGHPDASTEKFRVIDEAFKVLQQKFAKNRRGIDDEEEKIFDILHTAPQHRQYLSFDGIGVGTPFQREKQYQQVKAMKAQERVLDHRIYKAQSGESSLIKKSGGGEFYKNHAIKTKYGFDRVVEDLIQEAMSKGDFDKLSGLGKPLTHVQSQNAYLDFTTHKLNKILLDNGFTPEWISLQREIREEVRTIKKRLADDRGYLGETLGTEEDKSKWELIVASYDTDIERVNKKIDYYNLIVPILENQMFHIRSEQLALKVLGDKNLARKRKREISKETANNGNKNVENSSFLSYLGSFFSV